MSAGNSVRRVQIPLDDNNGFVFDAAVAGSKGDPLVLLLHGFPQTLHTYRYQMVPLADAGFFAVAVNQRGYSPGARPARQEDYATGYLVADVLAMIQSLGYQRTHLVGHDWGGQIAWLTAALHAQAVDTLTVLSRPHPAAFAAAMKNDAAQAGRSRHHRAFQDAGTVDLLLADDARRLRASLSNQGVPPADVQAYLDVLGEPAALEAAVNWYREAAGTDKDSPLAAANVAAITVPTLYIWGDADATVGRVASEATREQVTAAYRFEVLPGVGHFVTDQAGEAVTDLLLEHLRSH